MSAAASAARVGPTSVKARARRWKTPKNASAAGSRSPATFRAGTPNASSSPPKTSPVDLVSAGRKPRVEASQNGRAGFDLAGEGAAPQGCDRGERVRVLALPVEGDALVLDQRLAEIEPCRLEQPRPPESVQRPAHNLCATRLQSISALRRIRLMCLFDGKRPSRRAARAKMEKPRCDDDCERTWASALRGSSLGR